MDQKDLFSHILDIKEKLAGNSEIISSHTQMLRDLMSDMGEVKEQTRKTNGRVTSLEATVVKLAEVSSTNSGIIVDIQNRIREEIAAGDDVAREVDELGKSLTPDRLGFLDGLIESENQKREERKDMRIEVGKSAVSTIVSSAVGGIVTLLGYLYYTNK